MIDQINAPMYSYDENENILTINEKIDESCEDNDKCSFSWDKYKGKVKKIIINEKITQIPKRAFTNCPKLATVELLETITSIGEEAFANCYHLIEINIPENCTIAPNAFKNCFTLDAIKVLTKLFVSINVKDINIQHQIENIMFSLKNITDEDIIHSELIINMKQFCNIIESKENFVQLVTRFISLIMPLCFKIKDLDLQYNTFTKVINKDNLIITSIPSSIHFNDFRNNKCDSEFKRMRKR